MIIAALIGLKKCGKTTTAEALISGFKKLGYKVGGVKFMPNSIFTIDKEGKDTLRQKQAGADFVVSLSKNEMAYIKRMEERAKLEDVLETIPRDTDVLVCEGLNTDHPDILRIVLARSHKKLDETIAVRKLTPKRQENIIAISGIIANTNKSHPKYPIFNCATEEGTKGLINLILKKGNV